MKERMTWGRTMTTQWHKQEIIRRVEEAERNEHYRAYLKDLVRRMTRSTDGGMQLRGDAIGEAEEKFAEEAGAIVLSRMAEALVFDLFEIVTGEPIYAEAIGVPEDEGFKTEYREVLGLAERSTAVAVK